MKILALLFFCCIGQAREGLFVPSHLNANSIVRKNLASTVSFSPGSGVVIDHDKIATAAHVLGSCECPSNGVPGKCDRTFKVPVSVSPEGLVTSWKTGKVRSVLACGNKAREPKIDWLPESFLNMNSLKEARTLLEDYGYSPREDVMIVSFDNSQLKVPSATLRSHSLAPGEPLFVLGYSSLTLRSRSESILRKKALEETLTIFSGYINQLQSRDFIVASSQIQSDVTKLTQDLSTQMDQMPIGSYERMVMVTGPLAFLPHVPTLFTLWNQRTIDPACQKWKMEINECYSQVWQSYINNDVQVLKKAIAAIEHENEIDYPPADSSLRVSYGKFKNYQISRLPKYPGQIITDVDVVSGNSGGPIFDQAGLLVGVTASGQSAASLTYIPGEGDCGFSHYLIRDLLK